jgi:hypothetical protein
VSRTSRGTLVRHNTLSENAAPMVLAEPTPQAFVIAGVLVAEAVSGRDVHVTSTGRCRIFLRALLVASNHRCSDVSNC